MPCAFDSKKPLKNASRHIRRIAALLWFVAWLCCTSSAVAQRFEARLFDQQDGLDNLSVTSILQDGKGYLWIGTQNGLFRYDGTAFLGFGRTEGLTKPGVYSLLVDAAGNLWAGTNGGLFQYDGHTFHEIRYGDQSLRMDTDSRMAATRTGEVIIQTATGLYSALARPQAATESSPDAEPLPVTQAEPVPAKAAGRSTWNLLPYRARHPLFPDIVSSMRGIMVDDHDHLWFGCDKAICEFAEALPTGSTQSHLRRLGPENGVAPDYYSSLFLSRSGRFWARGRSQLVSWMPGETRVQQPGAALPAASRDTLFLGLAEDKDGRILTPTAEGFAVWNGSGWHEVDSSNKGSIDGATGIFVDKQGTLWIGTQGTGVLQSLGYGKWQNYSTAEGLHNPTIYALAQGPRGEIWMGGTTGISIAQPGAPRAQPLSLPGVTQVMSLVPARDGGMWLATVLGQVDHVVTAGKATGTIDRRYAVDATVNRMRVDRDNQVWVATDRGLYSLQCVIGRPCGLVAADDAHLKATNVEDIALDTKDGGLWTLANGQLGHYLKDEYRQVVVHPAVGAEKVRVPEFSQIAVSPDGQTLWLAGDDPGVAQVRLEGSGARLIETYTRPRLSSDFVEFLETDLRGRVWVGTDHGVNILSGKDTHHLTQDDGLIWNDADGKAFLPAPDGTLWIGTSQGVSHLLDPEVITRRPPMLGVVDQLRYNGVPFESGGVIPWSGGTAVLHFGDLSFSHNHSEVFNYQMNGLESKTITTHFPFVRFQQLPPGEYKFSVVIEDRDHGTFSAPAEISFTLQPPWWRTWWAFSLLGLAGVVALAAVWRWSHHALLAQRGKLQRLVLERTRELEIMARHDALTGLLNRRAALAILETEFDSARRQGKSICIALADIDHFKHINDTFGHSVGDHVLQECAVRLNASVRTSDMVGRYGGEEFLILFREVDSDLGFERAEAMRQILSCAPVVRDGRELTLTCSIGIACSNGFEESTSDLIARADMAMYAAKANGRNRVEHSAALV